MPLRDNATALSRRRASGAAHERLLKAADRFTDRLSIILHGCHRHPLSVVHEEGAGAGTRRPILGRVSRARALSMLSQIRDVGASVRCDAAEDLNDHRDHTALLDNESIMVLPLGGGDVAFSRPVVERAIGLAATPAAPKDEQPIPELWVTV